MTVTDSVKQCTPSIDKLKESFIVKEDVSNPKK
jgi:hypothetical protein